MRINCIDQRARERFAAYQANESFYAGEPAAQLTVLSAVKRDEVRAVFNYARDVLTKHAAATVTGLESTVTTVTPSPTGSGMIGGQSDSRAIDLSQQALDRVLTNSASFTTDFTAVLNAIVLGDAAFYVSHEDGEVYYRFLHPGDVDVLEWSPSDKPLKVMVQFDDRIETWTKDTLLIEGNSGTPSSLTASGLYANPYGLIPVILWPNWPRIASRWGDSTLEHIKAACRLLNERLDLLMWLIRVQGNPPVKAIGIDQANLKTDPGEVWTAPLGATIDLVKLMDAETAGIHQSTIQMLLQIVKELSNTPDVAYGIANTQLSGRALELAYMPMIQAAAIRRGFLGDAINRRNHVILRMTEVLQRLNLHGHYDTLVTFDSVIPADVYEARNQDRQDVNLGTLSRETYITRHLQPSDPATELDQVKKETPVLPTPQVPAVVPPGTSGSAIAVTKGKALP
jgi:Phage portal protein, SPP1 Gp6-like